MAAIVINRVRPNTKPGRRVLHIVGTWNGADTTGTLAVEKGNIIDVRGISTGTATLEYSACSDAVSNGMIAPTASGVGAYINMTRSSGGASTVHAFMVEYDSI